jgi:hypothetical protein
MIRIEGVLGQHEHEVDSPSFYNNAEISKVVEICKSLVGFVDTNGVAVSSEHIGVIGAFRSQILRLRNALRMCNMSGINVGSVEDFQGQETRIIIVSTVLTQRMPTFEFRGAFGLMGDARRFNVAITRGKELAIVVGHPHALNQDNNWKQLLHYCDFNHACVGVPDSILPSKQNAIDIDNIIDEIADRALGDGNEIYESYTGNMSRSDNMKLLNQYFGNELEWRGII